MVEKEKEVELVDGLVYVNKVKEGRVKQIVSWLIDGVSTKSESEAKLKDKFADLIAAEKEKVAEKDYKEYVYVKLGGLIRTNKEQKDHDAEVAKKEKEYKAGKR